MKREMVLGGLFGLITADALGVPVEFTSRLERSIDPVKDMRAYGTYSQPKGTWSDDSTMTLCTMDSLLGGVDYNDLMARFCSWLYEGKYTAWDELFDIGGTTRHALMKGAEGVPPLECGERGDHCGNGSLMRILPASLYAFAKYGYEGVYSEEAMSFIHDQSRVTHAADRCMIACGLYSAVVWELMAGKSVLRAVADGLEKASVYYLQSALKKDFRKYFDGMSEKTLLSLEEEDVSGSGYVVDTLVAALWCLLTTEDYRSCALRAVNLGEDTDTVGAVAGGLAGLAYGYAALPEEWVACLAKRGWLEEHCAAFADCLAALFKEKEGAREN